MSARCGVAWKFGMVSLGCAGNGVDAVLLLGVLAGALWAKKE